MLLSDPPTALRLRLGGVTRCMCALRLIAPQPAGPGPLPSRGLFLNRASVRRHIASSKNCRAADLGYREIHVEARAGDVMAGGGERRALHRMSDTSHQVTHRQQPTSINNRPQRCRVPTCSCSWFSGRIGG